MRLGEPLQSDPIREADSQALAWSRRVSGADVSRLPRRRPVASA